MSVALRAACCSLLLTACGADADPLPPAGQILLFVDTDAPLPAAPGSNPLSSEPPALFDRLRIDLGRPGELESDAALTQREFVLDRGQFDAGPLSVGIVPPAHEPGYAARLRLYRSADALADVPAPSSSIDKTLPLPAVPDEGIVRLLVRLDVDDTANPLRLEQADVTEPPATSSVGSWSGATRVPCREPPAPDEACVPGGAFWMGDPELRNDTEVEDAEREHLVVMSPFFIDTHEVTVAQLREAQPALAAAGVPLPALWSGKTDGLAEDDYSTFTLGPSDADPSDAHAHLPVNGVLWETARAYCLAVGRDLPSEAMFEFVSSGRGLEQRYVWGDDAPDCADVVAGRAGLGVYATFDGACRPSSSIGGVLPVGSGASDRLQLGAALVLDLAGNLGEWTLDWLNAEDEGVWIEQGVLEDPIALEQGRAGARRTARGGSWRGRFVELRAAARVGRDPKSENRSQGFRCARRA